MYNENRTICVLLIEIVYNLINLSILLFVLISWVDSPKSFYEYVNILYRIANDIYYQIIIFKLNLYILDQLTLLNSI